jgi:hypothetical protein
MVIMPRSAFGPNATRWPCSSRSPEIGECSSPDINTIINAASLGTSIVIGFAMLFLAWKQNRDIRAIAPAGELIRPRPVFYN